MAHSESMTNPPPLLLTTKQASARSGISRRTLHRRVLSGDLVPAQTLQMGRHGTYLFTVESIDGLRDDDHTQAGAA